jgi:hypothetical protein
VRRLTNGTREDLSAPLYRFAYELFLARGCEHGHDIEDWLQAERELNESAGSTLMPTSNAFAADATSVVPAESR